MDTERFTLRPPRHRPTLTRQSGINNHEFLLGHINTYVYIHHKNKNSFWFYVRDVSAYAALGYVWENDEANIFRVKASDIVSFF